MSSSPVAPTFVSTHPNAGLPTSSAVRRSPEYMADILREFRRKRGASTSSVGCCGTTPAHIKAVAEQWPDSRPRRPPPRRPASASADSSRSHWAGKHFCERGRADQRHGSRKFARLI